MLSILYSELLPFFNSNKFSLFYELEIFYKRPYFFMIVLNVMSINSQIRIMNQYIDRKNGKSRNDKFLYPIIDVTFCLLCKGRHLTSFQPLYLNKCSTLNVDDFTVFVGFEFVLNWCVSFESGGQGSEIRNKITGVRLQ